MNAAAGPSDWRSSVVGVGPDSPYLLNNVAAYASWRADKLNRAEAASKTGFIDVADLANPTPAERAALLSACRDANMALYRSPKLGGDASRTRAALAAFARVMGLTRFEEHRSAVDDGVVPIEVADTGGRAGFIPYSDRAINWHTDGYYSYRGPGELIRAMVLHCVRNAAAGGENAFLDQDIAYIRLRDADPAFIEAMMHPRAMTIPGFDDEGGKSHGEVAGPVFVVNGDRLTMRFTIRKRNVIWRDDPVLAAARDKLAEVLASDPLIRRGRLNPDEGILCNNVLHDRTAFTNNGNAGAGRLLYRIRSFDPVAN